MTTMESYGTSLNTQTEPVYRYRAPGVKERIGSVEERPLKIVSRAYLKSSFWPFPIEYAAIYQEDYIW